MTQPAAPDAEEKPVRKMRCAICDRPFSGVIFISILGRFCSDACQSRAEELEQFQVGR